MNPEEWRRIEELFDEICDASPEQREDRLATIEDATLAAEVRSLLAVDSSKTSGLENSVERAGAEVLATNGTEPKPPACRTLRTSGGRVGFIEPTSFGVAISRYCESYALDTEMRIALFLKLCSIIELAHRHGHVHGDLHAQNIRIDPDTLEFRISGYRLGTPTGLPWPAETDVPEHASPAQLRGEATTRADDVYQLGALLYRLLTDTMPFPRGRRPQHLLAYRIAQGGPEPPSSRAAFLAESELDDVATRALAAPEERFPSVGELRAAVERSRHSLTRPPGLVDRVRGLLRRVRTR